MGVDGFWTQPTTPLERVCNGLIQLRPTLNGSTSPRSSTAKMHASVSSNISTSRRRKLKTRGGRRRKMNTSSTSSGTFRCNSALRHRRTSGMRLPRKSSTDQTDNISVAQNNAESAGTTTSTHRRPGKPLGLFRGAWTAEEDIILISGVRKEGKKWAYIAKCLQDTRTEHTVKNRYKSILTRFRKELKERRLTCERDLLSVIYERLQAMTNQSILLSPEEEIMEEIEVSQEIRMPQEPVKTIQSCSQLTDVPGDEYPTLSFKQEPSQQGFGEWLEFEDFHQRRSPSLDCGYPIL